MQPQRNVSPWLQLAIIFLLPVVGFFSGLGLAAWAAPGSGLAAGVSGILLPTSFVAGLLVWAGLDFVVAFGGLIRRRRRTPAPDLSPHAGAWFLPLAVGFYSFSGLVAGLVPGGQGVVASVLAYGAAGAVAGWIISRLAAAGYLPGPLA